MSSQFDQIRSLLDEIEGSRASGTSPDPVALLDDASQLIAEVVDYLQPLLTPYQAAFYWYLLRNSYFRNGGSLVRVSTRGLGKGVVKSARSERVSQSQVKELLMALEVVGAIRKEAEPNREGTLYRVLTPSQIDAAQDLRSRLTAAPLEAPTETDADYYNIRENRKKVYERDQYVCHYCSKQLDERTATLDHIVAVAAGGTNALHNLVTSCLSCNSRKNHRPVGDFLAEQPKR